MARTIEKLSPKRVRMLTRPGAKPGMYADGGNLWLHCGAALAAAKPGTKPGGSSWIFRYMIDGRAREMGLGPTHTVSLAEARELARMARMKLLLGIDPLAERDAARKARALEAARSITFRATAEKYIAANKTGWKNAKHRDQWKNTLTTYVYPLIGGLPVGDVDTGAITKILQPLWTVKSETAGRVRGRIEAVLNYAKVHGWFSGENPARWRGHLENVLPKRSKVRKVRHHPALPYDDMASFMHALQQQKGVAAQALEFLILTATRSNEVLCMRPEEVKNKVWIIPEGRMKGEREHRVPLPDRAVEIVEKMREGDGDFLFPGAKEGRPLSNMAMLELVRGMTRDDGKPWTDRHGETVVPHGFRSSFRDWVSDCTSFPPELAEMALAHAIDDKTEAAYRRSDMFEKRRLLMAAWANFIAGRGSVTVLPAAQKEVVA
jgi:integrase